MALAPSVEFPASTAYADPSQDNEYLAGLLAETTGRPLDEVQGRLRCERRLLGSNVGDALRQANLEPHVWNDGLIAFYGATDAFLYETVVWNQMAEKEAIRQWIIEFLRREQPGPQRILAYGDGPGIDSLRLAQVGHQVTYFEVGDRNLRFARQLFADAKVAVEIVSAEAPWQTAAYDAVVCLERPGTCSAARRNRCAAQPPSPSRRPSVCPCSLLVARPEVRHPPAVESPFQRRLAAAVRVQRPRTPRLAAFLESRSFWRRPPQGLGGSHRIGRPVSGSVAADGCCGLPDSLPESTSGPAVVSLPPRRPEANEG